jgi:hypothetical protein
MPEGSESGSFASIDLGKTKGLSQGFVVKVLQDKYLHLADPSAPGDPATRLQDWTREVWYAIGSADHPEEDPVFWGALDPQNFDNHQIPQLPLQQEAFTAFRKQLTEKETYKNNIKRYNDQARIAFGLRRAQEARDLDIHERRTCFLKDHKLYILWVPGPDPFLCGVEKRQQTQGHIPVFLADADKLIIEEGKEMHFFIRIKKERFTLERDMRWRVTAS